MRRIAPTLFAAVFAIAACSGSNQHVDVAPEVVPAMYRISSQMRALDQAIAVTEPQVRQQGVLAALGKIEEHARELSTTKLRKSHELMETEIDTFVADIVKARSTASESPPNYYWAGKLHATCIRCHDPEGGIWTN
jgi:hypothetical protein